jgi:DNA invertase Pin-like site-specific DNA recombinase
MGTVIYCRISDDRAGTSAGVQRQETDCRDLCAGRGWENPTVFVDNDVSAYNGRVRPAYRELLEQVKAGTVSAIVAWHPDRLHRSPRELENFIDLVEAHSVAVATVLAGTYDLTTATGRMTARIVGATARYESELKSERTKRAHRQLAEAGSPVSGTRPFGWLADRTTLDPHEAALVREAAGRILEGETLWAITRDWQAREIRASRGGRWTQSAIRRILLNPRVAGYRTHHKVIVGPGKWEAILDEITWRRVTATIHDRATPGPRRARSYLLTGFLVCGRCGTKLIARGSEQRGRSYVRTSSPAKGGCGGIRIHADRLEGEVVAQVLTVLDSPEFKARIVHAAENSREVELGVEVDLLEARLEQAATDHYVEQIISRAQLTATTRVLTARLDAARSELTARRGRHVTAGVVGCDAGRFDELSLDRRRAVIAELVDRIVIGPSARGRQWDPERVKVRWTC